MAKKKNTIACKAIKELMEVTLRSRMDAKRIKELREAAKTAAIAAADAEEAEGITKD